MTPRPTIFISAVSKESKSARQLVSNTLQFLGYEPVWQEIFGTEPGDLFAVLRQKIDQCNGVIQLVGHCYGAESMRPETQFGRVSYTQFEALYARSKGKKVWYLFVDEHFPADTHDPEPDEQRQLQLSYSVMIRAETHLYYPLATREALEASVLKLRDDLTRLRRGARRWAAAVLILAALIACGTIWIVRGQQNAARNQQQAVEQAEAMQKKIDAQAALLTEIRKVIVALPAKESEVRLSAKDDPAVVRRRALEELAKEFKIDAKVLEKRLPQVAAEIQKSPTATSYERASAMFVEKNYTEAERLALVAADEAKAAKPLIKWNIALSYMVAGLAAKERDDYETALRHLRDAESFTSRADAPVDWASVQSDIGQLLLITGKFRDAEPLFRAALAEDTKALGPEHLTTLTVQLGLGMALSGEGKPFAAETEYRQALAGLEKTVGKRHMVTLATRNSIAVTLYDQGKYEEAELWQEALNKDAAEILGPEDPDTIAYRGNFANTLFAQRKFKEALAEFDLLLPLAQKVYGPDNPETLSLRGNRAVTLENLGRLAEAEAEHKAVLALREKTLGPEHPDTLLSRLNIATCLSAQGRFAEAEEGYRSVLVLYEKVLGPEHPTTLSVIYNLAICLNTQGKTAEALVFARQAAEGANKTLGPDHPDTKSFQAFLDMLEKETPNPPTP